MRVADDWGDEALPAERAARIKAELAPGERLVWAGGPDAGRASRHRMVLLAAAGLLMAAGGVFGIGGGHEDIRGFLAAEGLRGGLAAVVVFALLFIVMILLLIALILVMQDLPTQDGIRRTCYALTDRRAIVWIPSRGTEGTEVRSFRPADLNTLFRIERPDGTGDLIFREDVTAAAAMACTFPPGASVPTTTPVATRHGFFGIAEVRRIEHLVRQTLVEPRDDVPTSSA